MASTPRVRRRVNSRREMRGFVVGDEGVLVVDTFLTPAAVEDLLGVIAAETKQPIRYVVNTHYHLDHTGGNQVLAVRGVPIIAHERLMEWQMVKNRRVLPFEVLVLGVRFWR